MLAGYDKRVDYHYPTLKKMVYIMAFNWLLTTVMFIGIYLFLILLKFSLDGLALGFILLYVGEVISFTLLTNWKYRNQLLLNQKDQDEAKIGVWISIGFFVLILLLVITMASTMMLFNIENNSLEAARLLVFFFPYVILSLISLFFEQSRVKKAVQKGEKYKIDSLTYLTLEAARLLVFFFPYVILSLISLFFEQSRVKKAVQKGEKYKIDSLTYLMIVGCEVVR